MEVYASACSRRPGPSPSRWRLVPLLAQQPTFRAGVDVVKVDVSIARGVEHVSGLTAENFEVFDNGVKQKITNVAVAQVPLEVYLVLDLSGSVQGEELARAEAGGQRARRRARAGGPGRAC